MSKFKTLVQCVIDIFMLYHDKSKKMYEKN